MNMKYTIEKLAGVEYIFAPMEDAHSVTIEIMCKAWSIYEERNTNGISHFLEHLFFKWGKKYPTPKSVALAVDTFGGEFNAYTGDEYAGYYVKCAPEFLNQAIDVLWDMMINPQFPTEELEREKWVVIQELKMYEDNPMALVLNKWQEFYFGDNSYGWSTIGTEANVSSFTQEMLFTHKNNLYSKDNLIIVVSGKIDNIEDIKIQLEATFKDLPEQKKIKKPAFSSHIPKEKVWFFDKKTEQNHLVISAPGFHGNDDRKYTATILATMLWGNMSSRLFQNIREKEGLCYYIKAKHVTDEDSGFFLIRAGIDKARFDFGVERIWEELEAIARWDFTEEEFKNALGYTEWQIQIWIETSNDMASFLWSQYLIYGRIDTLEDTLAKYRKITMEDVKAVAKMVAKDKCFLYYIK